jgi:putative DNA primase/helicase
MIDFSKFDVRCQGAPACKNYAGVLADLLSQIETVDFREYADMGNYDKIPRKRYVVITVKVLHEIVTRNNWGLCTKDGFIYAFNGKYWQGLNSDEFKSFLADVAIKMGVPALDALYHQFKDEMYKQFLSDSNLSVPETKTATLINLRNVTFEVAEGKQGLREFRREDFLKYQLPFEYNSDAKCPMFNEYLHRVVPDSNCRKVLAEYLGYIFVRGLKLEKALILYGSGANGKSVFFDIVNALFFIIYFDHLISPARSFVKFSPYLVGARDYTP